MKPVTKLLYGWPAFVMHSVIIPLFGFCFVLLYNPLNIQHTLDMERDITIFNLTMLYCIYLGVMSVWRLSFHFLSPVMKLNYVLYACWCLGEVLAYTAFGAMYLTLMSQGRMEYFDTFLRTLGSTLLISIYPYLLLDLGFVIHNYRYPERSGSDNSPIIKFRDERQQLKLALALDSILFIEAAENYVKINYMDHDTLCTYTLRSSMKRIEDLVTSRGMLRCQRAFYINPGRVRLLRRDPKGFIYAEMECPEQTRVPISKNYYNKLSSIL